VQTAAVVLADAARKAFLELVAPRRDPEPLYPITSATSPEGGAAEVERALAENPPDQYQIVYEVAKRLRLTELHYNIEIRW